MANKVVIDVEARFIDNVSGKSTSASNSIDKLGKSADQAQKKVDNLSKKPIKPIFDADNNKFLTKIRSMEAKMNQMGHKKTAAVLDLVDKATTKIGKVVNAVQKFVGKTWRGMLEFKDSNALNTIRKVTSAAENLTKRTWSAMVKVKDMALAPIRAIKNALFSIPTLITAVVSAKIVQKAVIEPINLADQYSSAKIGFSTLLGDSAGQAMMDEIDLFAKKTPFKTSGVISNVQKMMAYGWDVDRVIDDMETIGDAAAATGKGDDGLTSIVYALSEIRSKGKLSTQELNQLASAGIKAKAYLANGLGYGTSDAGMMKLAKDLEAGAIGANQAVDLILQGMKEFDGMMDRTANETVGGLKAQLEDVFEINIARRWGQGLQAGAKKGLGSIVSLLDGADESLTRFGDTVFEVGNRIGNWFADKLGNAIERINEITGTWEFKNASLGEKVSMLWNGVIVDPLKEWWEGGGRDKTAETAGKIGKWMGKTLTSSLLAIFGATDVLNDINGADMGGNIAGSFVQGFLQNFDGGAITQAIIDAIGNVWNALPTWGKVALGVYGGGKIASGLGNVVGGIGNLVGGIGNMWAAGRGIIGATGNSMVAGSGVLGKLATIGYGRAGGAASAAGYFGLAGMSGGKAALLGGGTVAGLAGAGISGVYAVNRGLTAYQDYKEGNVVGAKANGAKAGATAAGLGAGALGAVGLAKLGGTIGTFFGGPIGTAVGAGIGGLVGMFAGNKIAKNIEAAAYESERMKEAVKDGKKSAEELNAEFEKAKWEKANDVFGDIKLSMEEIQRLANQVVWGDDLAVFEKFGTATKNAASSLQQMKNSSGDLDKWIWKAGLGVEFNDDEKEAIVASVDEYINSAKNFLENKHYEFSTSAELLLDLETEEGKSILEGGNAFYMEQQKQLDTLSSELSQKIQSALEDGAISTEPVTLPDGTIQLSEMDEILNLQEQIAAITEKVAQADYEAEIELINVKWGSGNLDSESFESFMSTMNTTIQERINAADEAFKVQVANLKLQFPDGGTEYQTKLETLISGYSAKVESIKVDIMDVETNIIGKAWDKMYTTNGDKLFPGGFESAKNAVSNALKNAIEQGIDSTEVTQLSGADLSKLLGFEADKFTGMEETAALVKDHLSGVLSQLELLEVDGNLLLKIGEVSTGEDTTELVKAKVDEAVPDEVETTTSVRITGEKAIENTIEILAEEFGISDEYAETVWWKVRGEKSIANQISIIASEFGIDPVEAASVYWHITGSHTVLNPLNLSRIDFNVADTYPFDTDVDVTGEKGTMTTFDVDASELVNMTSTVYRPYITIDPIIGYNKKSVGAGSLIGRYRGGIVGGSSAMGSFYRGGIAGYSDGGMVRGGSQLIEVAEEGSPEMIIPLSSQRRGRALKLWAQAGNIMGVPGFARGGMTSGGNDEGIRFQSYDSGESSSSQTVQIDVGGITFEINVNGDNPKSIVESIKAQAEEIAEVVAGVLADSLGSQFENMPLRGGVA